MLVLTRKPGERVVVPTIGLALIVLDVRGERVRLGFEAPDSVPILRSELAPDGSALDEPGPTGDGGVR